jgi:pimeloyl-ACP methyl ester carboxylesterase
MAMVRGVPRARGELTPRAIWCEAVSAVPERKRGAQLGAPFEYCGSACCLRRSGAHGGEPRFQVQVDVCLEHDTVDRLAEIAAPTLVIAGEFDTLLPPRHGRAVAESIPDARFEVLPQEAHQPFPA